MRIKLLFALILCINLLSGCFTTTIPPTESDKSFGDHEMESNQLTTVTEGWTPEILSVDIPTYTANNYFFPMTQAYGSLSLASDGGYYYIPLNGHIVEYVAEDGTRLTACPVGGCGHKDETCPAYVPYISRFYPANEFWYAITEDPEEISVLRIDPASGNRKKLQCWEAQEGTTNNVGSAMVWGEKLVIDLITYNYEQGTQAETVYSLSLNDGALTILCKESVGTRLRILGAVSTGILLERSVLLEDPMDYTSYMESHPSATDDEYNSYYVQAVEEYTYTEMELIDDCGQCVYAFPTSEEGLVPNVSGYLCWREWVLYQCQDILYAYDSLSQQTRTISQGPLFSYRICDGKAMQIREEGDTFDHFITDILTGETWDIPPADVYANIHYETDETFICNRNGLIKISKIDFYQADYDKAELIIPR